MAVTSHVYTLFQKSAAVKKLDLSADTLKVMLLTAYTAGQDTHQFLSDVVGAGTESSGTGYTAGGATLASVTLTASGHVLTLSCANPTWSNAITASYAVFYDSTPGSNATDPVICYWDFGGSQQVSGLTINASGLVTFTGS